MQDIEATFAGYQLHEVLSRDAVSTAYRATTGSSDPVRPGGSPTVALLISEPLVSETDRRQARLFERRAAAAMDINHPGVARVLDAGAAGDRVYMATAWRESVTLDELLSRAWQLSPEHAVELLRVLAEGLDVAHDAGLVHGALTTRTIRVDAGGHNGHRNAFVTGFGVDALLARRLGSKRQRDTGPVLDELLYVAPEQLRGDMLEPATDQYALACALYHCVSGQPPFVRETASALFGAHLFARPPVAGALATESSHALRDALATGLAKHPQDRHRSCGRLLRAALDGDGDVAPSLSAAFVPPTAASTAPSNGIGERMAAGVAATGATLGRARDGLAQRYRTRGRSVVDTLRHPQTTMLALAAVASAALLAVLIFMLLRSGEPAPTADAGDAQAANAVAEGQADAPPAPEPAAPDVAPEAAAPEPAPEPAPTAVVEWDEAVTGTAVSSLTAAADTVIAAADDEVVALDPASGAVRWRRPVDDGDVIGAAVTDDSYVYRSSRLHALALGDGRQLWTRDDQYTPTSSLTAVAGGPLYGTGPGSNMPELTAIDAATGDELWHFHHSQDDVHLMPNAGVAAGTDLVAVVQRGSLFAVDPDSEPLTTSLGRLEISGGEWRVDVARPWTGSITTLPNAVVVATRDGEVCSYAAKNGRQRWCQQVDGMTDRRPTLVPRDDAIVVATRTTLVALDPSTGAPDWEVPARSPINVAAVHGDTILTGDTAGTLRGFAAASGEQRWETTGSAAISSLAADGDGVYAGTRDGEVQRVRPQDG